MGGGSQQLFAKDVFRHRATAFIRLTGLCKSWLLLDGSEAVVRRPLLAAGGGSGTIAGPVSSLGAMATAHLFRDSDVNEPPSAVAPRFFFQKA